VDIQQSKAKLRNKPLPKLHSGSNWSVRTNEKTVVCNASEVEAWDAFVALGKGADAGLFRGKVPLARKGVFGEGHGDCADVDWKGNIT
jgi:hypothetical protein